MTGFRPVLACLVALLLMIVAQYSGLDFWLSSKYYQLSQGWMWQQSWLLETVIHRGGRILVGMSLLAMLVACIWLNLRTGIRAQTRLASSYLCVAFIMSLLSVAVLKHSTTLPCPWDVKDLGGSMEFVYFEQMFSSQLPVGNCFPSGHASGGFAFFSVFFAMSLYRHSSSISGAPLASRVWLAPGLLLGVTYGFAQQLRGAHFLSHDIASALVSWSVCYLCYRLFKRLSLRQQV
ncbi:phosphatase PAP2 family protein [Aliiglaciecola sp. LCG003]|uniref:phosphatase PAP2 family protein n=1 Tax=Aliiglaciecola sp. LCG003 TaxID=3053655 RepID=UPI002572A07D|nr:phosphatase PAP2 family protein [Aliiglaciecola sp. LCG003]WJG09900.1 phosphatase PAP2 family protein [Aliiglaciecola sp. LCG003]